MTTTSAAGDRDPRTPPPPARVIEFDSRSVRRSVVSILLIVTLWFVGLWVFQQTSGFLFLIMLSWLFAMAMEPAIVSLMRRGVGRSVATGVVVGIVVLVVILLGALFGNLFLSQLSQLIQATPGVVTEVTDWLNRTFSLQLDASSIVAKLSLTPAQVGTVASNLAGGVLGAVSSLFGALLDVFTFVVFAIYFAADGPRVRRAIGSWLSPSRQNVFATVADIMVAKTGGYVTSKIGLAALSTVFHAVFFALVGVPYPLPLALLVGLLSQFVPVLGTYVGIVVPLLFVVFSHPLVGLWIVLFATVYQQIENYVFTPMISRRTMDVNSGVALAAVFVGADLWGPIGALIGIPLAAAGVSVLDTYGRRHELVPALVEKPEKTQTHEMPEVPVVQPPAGQDPSVG